VVGSIFNVDEDARNHERTLVLILIIIFLWIAILAPFGIRFLRDGRAEKSIATFSHEHEALRRQGYSVAPARSLDDAEDLEVASSPVARPRLRVVRDEDTYQSLETGTSWDEWSQDYDYDGPVATPARAPRVTPRNRYAAYAATPSVSLPVLDDAMPLRRTSMKTRRTRIFLGLIAGAAFFTLGNLVLGMSLMQDVAVLDWMGLAGYVALALFAVSQGYLDQSSIGLGRFSRTATAVIEELPVQDSYDDEFYDEGDQGQWQREPARYALG